MCACVRACVSVLLSLTARPLEPERPPRAPLRLGPVSRHRRSAHPPNLLLRVTSVRACVRARHGQMRASPPRLGYCAPVGRCGQVAACLVVKMWSSVTRTHARTHPPYASGKLVRRVLPRRSFLHLTAQTGPCSAPPVRMLPAHSSVRVRVPRCRNTFMCTSFIQAVFLRSLSS